MSERNVRHLLSLAALVLVAGCSKKGAPDADEAKPAEAKAEVAAETAIAADGPFTESIGAIGAVEPRAGHFAVLSAPAATRVAGVRVAAGSRVGKGDTLVELEQSGFQSALRSAQAALAAARAARDRAQKLVDQGIAPRRDLDQAQAEFAKADADVVAAARLAELSILRAPMAGVVTRMSAAFGASVDPSQPLVEVADPAMVDVVLTVQPADAARIRVGSRVTLHSGQRADGESLGSGDVVDVAGIVDSASRSVAVRVRAASGKRPLRIGETLFGEIVLATRPHAITVPLAALVPEGDGYKVFVVDSESVAHARPVTVGAKGAGSVEILEGLKGGERVVTL
ncbi:MAG: efflux RND transporter periplasmic adaptor subunit, partial [Gemmatimonadota bacterium]